MFGQRAMYGLRPKAYTARSASTFRGCLKTHNLQTETIMHLSQEEIWLFRHNGFIVGRERLPDDLIASLNLEADHQIAERAGPLVWKPDPRDPAKSFVNRISELLQRSRVFTAAATHPAVLDPLESVLGPDIYLLSNWHNHLMVRPPGSPRIKWHRGASTFAPMLVTALLYMTESTVENGCVRVVPGSHVSPFGGPAHLVDEESRELAKRIAFEDHDLYRLSVPLPMPAGGVLLFNDALYHGAGINHGDADRRSITLAYMTHDDHAAGGADPTRIRVRGGGGYRGLSPTAAEDISKALPQTTGADIAGSRLAGV